MESPISKDERLEIRVSSADKKMFKKAQELSGDKSFSSFIVRIVGTEAQKIVANNERILASEKDRQVFFEAVLAHHSPNQNLAEAAKRYRQKLAEQ